MLQCPADFHSLKHLWNAESNHCDSVTWYNSQSNQHFNFCEVFWPMTSNIKFLVLPALLVLKAAPALGDIPVHLTATNYWHSSLLWTMKSVVVISATKDCLYYSWYTPEHITLQETCALLWGCSKRTGSKTCILWQSDCFNNDIREAFTRKKRK